MNLLECKRYMMALDSMVIGRTGLDSLSGAIQSVDGAVVLKAEAEALERWVVEQDDAEETDDDWQTYGGIIESLTTEGINFHMDAPAFEQFAAGMSEDIRFWPEILTFEDQGWVTVTSAFDMFNDDPSVLREELDNAVLGFHERCGVIVGPDIDTAPAGDLITYKAYQDAAEGIYRLNATALYRLKSIYRWEMTNRDITED